MDAAVCDTTLGTPYVALMFANRWSAASVADALEQRGMKTQQYSSPLTLVAALHREPIDIALIEDGDAHLDAFMAALRSRGATDVPIIAVGRGGSAQFSKALIQGATDYAVLDQAMDLFVNRIRARMEACLRQVEPESLSFGNCVLEAASRTLSFPAGRSQLTSREFGMAWLLFQHAGQVVSLNALSSRVWGRDVSLTKRTIEQHMCRLRKKFVSASTGESKRPQICAVHNVGYRLAFLDA